MNDSDPNAVICIVQSDRLVSQHVMDARLQFVCVSKRMFSHKILLLQFSFPLFLIQGLIAVKSQHPCVGRRGGGAALAPKSQSSCMDQGTDWQSRTSTPAWIQGSTASQGPAPSCGSRGSLPDKGQHPSVDPGAKWH